MSLLTIDSEKCRRDGICVASCPLGLIEVEGNDSIPVAIAGADERCLNCGHCVAVCPYGALSLKTMKPEGLQPTQKELLPDSNQVEYLMRSRRSIRAFKKKSIERETLAKLVDVTRHAPTGHNSQRISWLVIDDKDEIRRLAGIIIDWFRFLIKEQSPLVQKFTLENFVKAWESDNDMVLRNAPAIVINYAPKAYGAPETDCAIGLTYFELAASTYGLGTCWAGVINIAINFWKPLQEALGIPEEHKCSAMMVGYPKYRYHRIPTRNDAKIQWR